MITLIALAVLMMLVAGAIQFTGTDREASVVKGRADEMAACANVARKVLISKLRTFGVPPASITLNTQLPDNATSATTDDKQLLTAHMGSGGALPAQPVIVKLDSTAMGASRFQVRDMSNTLAQTTLGGEYYRVVVSCRNPVTELESEVEFTFRHGI